MNRVSKLFIYGLVIVGIAIAIITTNFFSLSNWATANNGITYAKRLSEGVLKDTLRYTL